MKRRGVRTCRKRRCITRKKRVHTKRRQIGGRYNVINEDRANKIKLAREKETFKVLLAEIENEQKDMPRFDNIIKLLQMVNQSTELLKRETMRQSILDKIIELEQVEKNYKNKEAFITVKEALKVRIKDLEERAAAA